MSNEKKKEFTLKITQANKTQMIVILYEMLLAYLDDARDAISEANQDEVRLALSRARACLYELINSLNFRYELAVRFLELYMFINKELARAEAKKDMVHIENSARIITRLLSAYRELSLQDKSPALMANSQTVYTGFTYDRTQLLESLLSNPNRGMKA